MSAPTTNLIQPALLFVPDISGFTQFVQATEIAHSRHIIEELLEKLTNLFHASGENLKRYCEELHNKQRT